MLMKNRMQGKELFIGGIALIVLRSILQQMVDRTGRSSDATDFLLGILFGVGIGLLMLFVWRLVRSPRIDRELTGESILFHYAFQARADGLLSIPVAGAVSFMYGHPEQKAQRRGNVIGVRFLPAPSTSNNW
jgi:hypothetical protein